MGPAPRAFEEATKYLVGNMLSSISKKLEIEHLYGQMGYAKIASAAAPVGADVELTLVAAEFAAGIWAGGEGMPISVYDGNTAVDLALVVKSVKIEERKITVTAVSAGAATALKAAVDADPNVLDIFHKGAKGKEFAGIHKILTNTGNLFGIDATEYTLWKGSEYDAGDEVLTFAIIQQAIAQGVNKGLDGDVVVMVNPGHWDDLLTEQAAQRMYDSSYSSATVENGAKTIKFHAQNGMVEIIPSIYIKEGLAFVLSTSDWVRVGSTDVTFKRPGQEGNFFLDLPDYAAYELRCYTDQALFCSKPGRSVVIKGLKIAQ